VATAGLAGACHAPTSADDDKAPNEAAIARQKRDAQAQRDMDGAVEAEGTREKLPASSQTRMRQSKHFDRRAGLELPSRRLIKSPRMRLHRGREPVPMMLMRALTFASLALIATGCTRSNGNGAGDLGGRHDGGHARDGGVINDAGPGDGGGNDGSLIGDGGSNDGGGNDGAATDGGPAVDGGCISACNAGDKSCASDGTLVTCVVTNGCGAFPSGGGVMCGAHQTCPSGGSACTCNSDVKCASGAGTYCTTDAANGNAPATYACAADGDGCVVSGATLSDCGAHQSCTGAAGSASCTCNSDVKCGSGAGTYCTTDAANGNAPATYACAADGNGCVVAGATLSDCGAHQSCTGAAGSASCACNTDANCSSAGTFCNGSASYITCSTDGQSCIYESGTTSCTGSELCGDVGASGTAACACPASGSGVGSGCSSVGAQACSGGDVVTCETSGGCNIWVDTAACSSVSLSCTASGASASCTCPAAGPTYFVDASATPITIGGVTIAANGAQNPSGCRFTTIGAGLTAAAAAVPLAGAGSVEVVGANPETFASESWPLTVPAGVQLFSSDTATTPTKFTIAPPAGKQAVVVQGGGEIEDFVISASLSGSNSPAAVSLADCTSTQPTATIAKVVIGFSGTATGDGINIADAGTGQQGCNGAIDHVSITGAYNGISVSSASGAASTTIGATITNSAITSSVNDGLLVYQTGTGGVTVSSSTIGGSAADNVWLDTATLAAHTGTLSITGTLGTTTIANSHAGAYGIVVTNNGTGQSAGGAVLSLTDVTIVGLVDTAASSYSNDALDLTNATATLSGYVSQTSGASRGLYSLGSTVTMKDDAGGNHCNISGSSDGNAGMRIDTGTTLTATNIVVQGNSTWGANITNGGTSGATTNVTLDNCTFSGQTGAGGVQVAGNDASDKSVLNIAGGSFTSNNTHGIHVGAYATVGITGQFSASGNGGDGILIDGTGASVVIGSPGAGPATIDSNLGDGIAQSAGSLDVHGNGSTSLAVSSNSGNGIEFNGAAAATTLTMSYLDVEKNGGNGIKITNSAGSVKLQHSAVVDHTSSSIVINNSNTKSQSITLDQDTITDFGVTPATGSYGIEIDQSSAASSSVYSTFISNSAVEGCYIGLGAGAGKSNQVAVETEGDIFEYNVGAGAIYSSSYVPASGSPGNALSWSGDYFVQNGVTTPASIGSGTVGGIGFAGAVPTTQYFDENVVAGNGGNQVYVYYTGGGSVTYDLHSGNGNEYAECAASGGYAVFVECTSGSVTVDADKVIWMSTTFPGNNVGTTGAGTASVSTNNAAADTSCPAPI
jgi:hypothetical protein